MSTPSQVRIKKRRHEHGPDTLILQGPKGVTKVRYVNVKRHISSLAAKAEQDAKLAPNVPASPTPDTSTGRAPRSKLIRREFHLQSPVTRVTGVKRKGSEDDVATFVEQKKSRQDVEDKLGSDAAPEYDTPGKNAAIPAAKHKGPGRGSAIRSTQKVEMKPETEEERQRFEALADAMRETIADIEVAQRPATVPKISGARSREMNQQRVASNKLIADVDKDSEDDSVYDTYVLVPQSDAETMQIDEESEAGEVGILVVADEQRELWETYLADEHEHETGDSEDEDENAEDYYGADYPEDEVSSDDENGLSAYRHRYYGSDDEVWDEDTGTHSDDEWDRMVNPFEHKTPQQFAKATATGYDSD